MLHSVNVEQGLYVLTEGKGYSCLGFQVAYKRARAVARWLNRLPTTAAHATLPKAENVGTAAGYEEYEAVMLTAATFCAANRVRCPVELTPELNGLLGRRVEVVDQDGERRRFWVGRSTGWLPINLEIARSNSSGGDPADSRGYRSVQVVR